MSKPLTAQEIGAWRHALHVAYGWRQKYKIDALCDMALASLHKGEAGSFLDNLRQMNKERCEQNFKHAITSWNIMEWGCALAGEAGELCNVLKKVQRERDGIEGSRVEGDSMKAIADELADVIIYGDLLAELCGIDIADAIASKFNETSKKVGYTNTLYARPPAAQWIKCSWDTHENKDDAAYKQDSKGEWWRYNLPPLPAAPTGEKP